MKLKYAASVLVLLAAGCSQAPAPPDAGADVDSGLTTVTLKVDGMH